VADLQERTDAAAKMLVVLHQFAAAQLTQLNALLEKVAAGQNVSDDTSGKSKGTGPSDQTALANFIRGLTLTGSDQSGIGSGTTSRCAPGSYAVGFDFQAESGLAHGALYAGTIVCRAFPTQQAAQ
jgi:hypothetical protein